MGIESLAKNLIGFKTTTGNVDEAVKCFNFIKKYLKDAGLFFKDYCFNNYHSLLISNTKNFDFDILFNGHIDVVSAKDELFEPKIVGDFLIGRGAIDMKGADSVMIEVIKNYAGDKKIGLLLTSDEEIGGFNGVGEFVKHEKFSSKLIVVPDGGSNYDITVSEKGVLQLHLTIKGKNAHSSTLDEGINAISKAYELFLKIVEKFCKQKSPPIDDNVSINLAFLHSGEIYNQVPDIAKMGLDFRFFKLNPNEIIEYIKSLDPEIKIDIYAKADSFETDVDNPYFLKFLNIVEHKLGKQKMVKTNGASDARFFSQLGLPVAIMNPIGFNFHGDDEKVSIVSLLELKEIYEKLMEEI